MHARHSLHLIGCAVPGDAGRASWNVDTPLEQIDNGTVLVQNGRILASGANVPLPHTAMHPFGRMLAPLAESAY